MINVSRLLSQKKKLENRLSSAVRNLCSCEEKYAKSDELKVLVMLMDAKELVKSLYWQLQSVNHYIANIEFYRECEREEREIMQSRESLTLVFNK